MKQLIDYKIEMRDGVKLSCDIRMLDFREQYPVIFVRTPYSNTELEEASIEVFPNPASEYVEIVQPYEHARVTITDLLGRVVLTQDSLNIRTRIDVSSLNAGTYVASITDSVSGKSVQRMVVLQ